MKRLVLSASLALALSGTLAFAQQDAPPVTARHHHARNPHREAARMSKQLNLSSDQTAKLEPILASRDQKIDALKSNMALTPQDLKQQMHAIHKDTKQQLATILTPDQMQQLRSHHHDHATPNQSQPQSGPQAGM
jgi:periplasmic protein CpxP/Spy